MFVCLYKSKLSSPIIKAWWDISSALEILLKRWYQKGKFNYFWKNQTSIYIHKKSVTFQRILICQWPYWHAYLVSFSLHISCIDAHFLKESVCKGVCGFLLISFLPIQRKIDAITLIRREEEGARELHTHNVQKKPSDDISMWNHNTVQNVSVKNFTIHVHVVEIWNSSSEKKVNEWVSEWEDRWRWWK